MPKQEIGLAAPTYGWIDSMSITQVVQAFEVWPRESVPYGWEVPRLVTALLINTRNIGLFPGFSLNTVVSEGPVGSVTRGLLRSGVMVRRAPDPDMVKRASERSRARSLRYASSLRTRYAELRKRPDQIAQGWMDWSVRSAWREHAQNFGGLIDVELIPELARILGVSELELTKLQKRTSSPELVEYFVNRQPENDDFRMTYDCFLLATLLRGVYHDYLADSGGQQVAHHPLRYAMLPIKKTPSLAYDQTAPEGYLTNIVLWSALAEGNVDHRLKRWVDSVAKVRAAYDDIDLRLTDNPCMARERAVRAAQMAAIDVHPAAVETFIDMTANAALGSAAAATTAVVLQQFDCSPAIEIIASAGAGGLTVLPLVGREVGRSLARRVYTRGARLSRLAESPPGRIRTLRQIISSDCLF